MPGADGKTTSFALSNLCLVGASRLKLTKRSNHPLSTLSSTCCLPTNAYRWSFTSSDGLARLAAAVRQRMLFESRNSVKAVGLAMSSCARGVAGSGLPAGRRQFLAQAMTYISAEPTTTPFQSELACRQTESVSS
eukprot:3935970-Rhodomonas_salina.1